MKVAAGTLKTTRRIGLLWVTFLAFALSQKTLSAKENANEDDLRCLVIGLQLSDSPIPNVKQAGLISTMYYLGKLSDDKNLEHDIFAAARNMKTNVVRASASGCSLQLSSKAKILADIGSRLQLSK